jgi:hypothetical protein
MESVISVLVFFRLIAICVKNSIMLNPNLGKTEIEIKVVSTSESLDEEKDYATLAEQPETQRTLFGKFLLIT